jgi:hypothetical protein
VFPVSDQRVQMNKRVRFPHSDKEKAPRLMRSFERRHWGWGARVPPSDWNNAALGISFRLPPPILFGLAFHRRRFRIFDLHPMR